jgi:hypothetical protein
MSTILSAGDQRGNNSSDKTGTVSVNENHSQFDYSTNSAMMPTVAALDTTCSVSVLPGHISHFNPDKGTKRRAAENRAAEGYKVRQIDSPEAFGAIIKTGCTWSAPAYKDAYRNQMNANNITTIAVEFDDVKPGVDDWQSLCQNTQAFAAIPSPSFHTGFEEGNKRKAPGAYRLVYRLSRPCRGGEAKAVLAEVMRRFGFSDAAVDTACKDVARYWNGCLGAELLWSSQSNFDNPLDVDRILADRLNRMGDEPFTADDVRFLSGYLDDGKRLELFGEWCYYMIYDVAAPKDWATKIASRHEALNPVQQALAGYDREDLAYALRRCVRGDSEAPGETSRQIGSSSDYMEMRAKSGNPYQAKVVELHPRGKGSNFDTEQARLDIFGAIAEGLTGSALAAKKVAMKREYPMDSRDFDRLWDSLEKEYEQSDSGSNADEIDQLLSASKSSLDLADVLPESIAEMFKVEAAVQSLRPELYMLCLLCAVGTLAQNGTSLEVMPGFTVRPNIFGAIVAPPSQKKSPVISMVVKQPLQRLSMRAKEIHAAELDMWQQQRQQAVADGKDFNEPEPAREIFYFDDGTSEGVSAQVNRCPRRGMLYHSDELAAVFKSQNQYRGGKGSDMEKLLSLYDASGGDTGLRAAGVSYELPAFNYGIIGGIQPGVLADFLGNCEDANGAWARFFLIDQPVTASSLPDRRTYTNNIASTLYEYYRVIADTEPQSYRMDDAAFDYFAECCKSLDEERVSSYYDGKHALSAAIGKMAGRIAKIALIIHLIESACAYELAPDLEVGIATVHKAALIAELSLEQIRAIYQNAGGDGENLSPILAKIIQISQRKGAIDARAASQGLTPKQRGGAKPADIRQMFITLAGDGYGEVCGTGTKITFTAYPERRVGAIAGSTAEGTTEYDWTKEVA